MAEETLQIGGGIGEIAPLVEGEGAFQEGGFQKIVGEPGPLGAAISLDGLGKFPFAIEQIALQHQGDGRQRARLGRVGDLIRE